MKTPESGIPVKKDIQLSNERAQEVKRAKELAARFEAFCRGQGDRMFRGRSYFVDKNGEPLISSKEASRTSPSLSLLQAKRLRDSVPYDPSVYNPKNDPEAKEIFDDDINYKKLLEHPAFKEKVDSASTFIDIGNGGNIALRVDAAFLKRNGFKGKVIGVDPFNNRNEINTERDLHTEAVEQDGLSYLLEVPDGESNILCSNLEYEIIENREYAIALVKEIFRVVCLIGVFLFVSSRML